MNDREIKAHLQKGWIQAIVTFEVVGKPAAHVEKALDEYLENIKKDHRIIMLSADREEAVEHDDGMCSAFCETEMLVKDLETFTWLCINFSPAGIEILEPDELRVESRDITNWLNDLLSKIHEIGTNIRASQSASTHLTIALNELIKNAILLALKTGPKSEAELAKETGIADEQLAPFLAHMLEKERIEKKDGRYTLPDPAKRMKLTNAPPTTKVSTKVKHG
jgi:hypothetical protein